MGHSTINGKPIGSQPSRQVISRSAILILSGILIGTAFGQGGVNGLGSCRFCAGMVGAISYIGLELIANGRRKRIVRKRLAIARSTLKSRLSRHVSSHSPQPPKCRLSPISAESSYLPVMMAGSGRWEGPEGRG
jgi:hypothetical protein